MNLFNLALKDIDPHDPALSDALKVAILEECLINPQYFFSIILDPKRMTANQIRAAEENIESMVRGNSAWEYAESDVLPDWVTRFDSPPGFGLRFDRAVFPSPTHFVNCRFGERISLLPPNNDKVPPTPDYIL